MAAKKSKLQPETIAIETTQLKINVKTTGDLITKDYKQHLKPYRKQKRKHLSCLLTNNQQLSKIHR